MTMVQPYPLGSTVGNVLQFMVFDKMFVTQ